MIELIRTWLIGITCAAIVVALCESLAPSGAVRKVGRFAGGLVLLIAVLQPFLTLDMRDLSGFLNEYRIEAGDYSTELETENEKLMKNIIEEQTGAYILDKAAALGIDSCEVSVEAAAAGDGEYPIPEAVTVTGNLSENQRSALSRQIEADLAIPAQRQIWEDVK